MSGHYRWGRCCHQTARQGMPEASAMRMDLSSHYRRCLMWKPWVDFVNGFAFRGESHHCAQILTHVIFNSRHEDYIVAVGCTTWVHRGGHRRDETTSRTPQTFPIQCQFVLQGWCRRTTWISQTLGWPGETRLATHYATAQGQPSSMQGTQCGSRIFQEISTSICLENSAFLFQHFADVPSDAAPESHADANSSSASSIRRVIRLIQQR